MGNSDSRGKVIENAVKSEDDVSLSLNSVYQNVTNKGTRPLTDNLFKEVFFKDHCELSDALFVEMTSATSEQSSVLDPVLARHSFVEQSVELLDSKSPTQQLQFYCKIFSKKESALSKENCLRLLRCCYLSALSMCGFFAESANNEDNGTTFDAMLTSLFGSDESMATDRVRRWVERSCPGLVDCLHLMVSQRLMGKQLQHVAGRVPELYTELDSHKHLLTVCHAWLLSCLLPYCYIPSPVSAETSVPLNSILSNGWRVLYDSNKQGLSVNRFQHHVFQYKAATVMFVSFEGHCYCLAVSEEWREHTQWWGGQHCYLIQISPEFKLVQSGSDLVFLNWSLRSLPSGLQIGGKDSRVRVLELDDGLNQVKHFNITQPLHRLEVWGCGGHQVHEAQRKQKDWEKHDALKHKDRKLKIDSEDWKNSPDRQILEMGGVSTEHAKR